MVAMGWGRSGVGWEGSVGCNGMRWGGCAGKAVVWCGRGGVWKGWCGVKIEVGVVYCG